MIQLQIEHLSLGTEFENGRRVLEMREKLLKGAMKSVKVELCDCIISLWSVVFTSILRFTHIQWQTVFRVYVCVLV
jgi:hypothetical protein